MLRFVTKEHYWSILDRGVMDGIQEYSPWCLKNIQDAVAFSHLRELRGLDIAEIGAGVPRLISALGEGNRCTVVDEYKGVGNGPKRRSEVPNVAFVDCMMGSSEELISPDSFDVLFSVSVVEHVPIKALSGFFSDCWRVLRPGGLMVHLIDVYSEDAPGSNDLLWRTISEYERCVFSRLFEPVGEMQFRAESDLRFKTSYATNPDSMMRQWNRTAPTLTERRKRSQSCTIEMVAKKR